MIVCGREQMKKNNISDNFFRSRSWWPQVYRLTEALNMSHRPLLLKMGVASGVASIEANLQTTKFVYLIDPPLRI